MRSGLVLFLLLFLVSCQNNTSSFVDPWNLPREYSPKGSQIKGIPVHMIDANWVEAEVLKYDYLPRTAKDYFKKDLGPYAFEKNGDFNHDGIADKALVGVYRDKRNKLGDFILILSKKPSGGWKVIFHKKIQDIPNFAVLNYANGILEICFCMECDDGLMVKWNGQSFILKSCVGD